MRRGKKRGEGLALLLKEDIKVQELMVNSGPLNHYILGDNC